MATTTPNHSFVKPDDGESDWGTDLRGNWDIADGLPNGEIKRVFLEAFSLDSTNPPSGALAGYTPVLDFDPATDQLIYVVFPIPADMDVAIASKLQISVTMSTSAAANFVFAGDRVEHKAGEDITAAGTAFTATLTPNATLALLSRHDVVTFAGATFEQLDNVTLRLFRDANNGADTHGGNLRLVTVELEYTTRRGAAT